MASQLTFTTDKEKTLSLCIPTYNRAECLRQQFIRLLSLPAALREKMEIIISDNCSTDKTQEVVGEYRQKLNFTYLRNSENLGPDRNFLQCLYTATGKYVWLLGDDDYLRTERMPALLALLDTEVFGLIHIRNTHREKEPYRVYTDLDQFLSQIKVWITFMSANIIQREFIRDITLDKYASTNLLQVPMYLNAAIKCERNVIFYGPFFDAGAEMGSNGGYNVIRVFVQNLLDIYDEFEERGISPHTIMVLRGAISDFIFPYVLNYMILHKGSNFHTRDGWKILKHYLGLFRIFYAALKFFTSPRNISRELRKLFKLFKKYFTILLARLSLLVFPVSVADEWHRFMCLIASWRFTYSIHARSLCFAERPFYVIGSRKYIHIGRNFSSRAGMRLECVKAGGKDPSLTIGDDVRLGNRVHLGVMDSITIGHRVLMGSDILITDHSHGHTDTESLTTPPNLRPLYSKGPITIGDDVWIGDQVIILPGITIGHNSVIGAGSVVTHDVAPFSIVVGNPARKIKGDSIPVPPSTPSKGDVEDTDTPQNTLFG